MRKLFPILFVTVLAFTFIVGGAKAQDAESEAFDKYGISFPIEYLGNCESIGECRSYCDDPVNSTECIEYSKSKGFYNEEEIDQNKTDAIKRAKSELGCDSEVSCRYLCEQPGYFTKCSQFAQKYNLVGGAVQDTASEEIVKKAQEILGCGSENSCKSFCEKDENKGKCNEFAKTAGLRGGEVRVGPGGCASQDTCRAFCSNPDNYRICQSYSGAQGGNFSGPGGCDSEESCKKYCEDNPTACGYKGSNYQSGQYNPVDMCSRTQGCYWGNNTCNCSSSNSQTTQTDPAKECVKYSGCSWLGNSCRCTTPIYNSNYSNNSEDYKASCTSGGCNWTGSSCDCSGTSGPAMQCGNKGCSWINSSCQCNSTSNYQPSSGSGGYSEGSSMNKDQQEYYCKAGGGSCDWTSGYCNCKGYSSPYSTPSTSNTTNYSNSSYSGGSSGSSSTGTSTSTYTSPSSAPSGMTRDSQQAGCTSCGGTCTWNGDFCNCQCSNSQNTTPPPPPPPPPPAYVDPYQQCIQSGGSWAGGQCYPGGVQGTSIAADFWEWIVSLFK